MLETSARLLRLLSLLQIRRDWTGTELAQRFGVTTRTIRNDIGRLRELGSSTVLRPLEVSESKFTVRPPREPRRLGCPIWSSQQSINTNSCPASPP